MRSLYEALNWRSAVKVFDESRKLENGTVKQLLKTTLLSASSFGIQPWKFISVSDEGVKKQLQEAGYGQTQFGTASHIVIFAVKKNVDAEYVEKYMQSIAESRGIDREALNGFAEMLNGTIVSKGEELNDWSARQVYIALGTLLSAAALENIDCSPMEGFDGEQFDAILDIKEEGYHALAAVALGYRSSEDTWSQMPKARFPYEEVVKEL